MSKEEVSNILDKEYNHEFKSEVLRPKMLPTNDNSYGKVPGSDPFSEPDMPGLEMLSVKSKKYMDIMGSMSFLFADGRLIQTKVWYDGVSTFGLRDMLMEKFGGANMTLGEGFGKTSYYRADTPDFTLLLETDHDATNTYLYYFAPDSDAAILKHIQRGKDQAAQKKQDSLGKVKL